MLVVGTKIEYFEAVWVKNEWSRFMKLMKNDRSKMLIPCYRDMDAYDLPEDFAHLQAQDMSKIGFINDVVRGIKKVLTPKEEPKAVEKTVVENITASSNVEPLIERAFMFLEDGKWESADEYCEKVLDLNPKCAEAYLGKLMIEHSVRNKDELATCSAPFDTSENYNKIVRFGEKSLIEELDSFIEQIKERNEQQRLENDYISFKKMMKQSKTEDEYKKVAKSFEGISGYKDADTLKDQCMESSEKARKDAIYDKAMRDFYSSDIPRIKNAIKTFETIIDWKDSKNKIKLCEDKIVELKKREKENEEAKKKKIKIAKGILGLNEL